MSPCPSFTFHIGLCPHNAKCAHAHMEAVQLNFSLNLASVHLNQARVAYLSRVNLPRAKTQCLPTPSDLQLQASQHTIVGTFDVVHQLRESVQYCAVENLETYAFPSNATFPFSLDYVRHWHSVPGHQCVPWHVTCPASLVLTFFRNCQGLCYRCATDDTYAFSAYLIMFYREHHLRTAIDRWYRTEPGVVAGF
eukprot:1189905-Prorocentrum_minimum.AAC.2